MHKKIHKLYITEQDSSAFVTVPGGSLSERSTASPMSSIAFISRTFWGATLSVLLSTRTSSRSPIIDTTRPSTWPVRPLSSGAFFRLRSTTRSSMAWHYTRLNHGTNDTIYS